MEPPSTRLELPLHLIESHGDVVRIGGTGGLNLEPGDELIEAGGDRSQRDPVDTHTSTVPFGVVLSMLDLRGRGSSIEGLLPRPRLTGGEPTAAVAGILAAVRSDGDAALRRYTAEFDGVDVDALRVPTSAVEAAVDDIEPPLREALLIAIDNVRVFHEHQRRGDTVIERDGLTIHAYQKPVRRAGLYVPGGRAVYPSTVVMTAVPARVAGVEQIALCVPPNRDTGKVAPVVLAAAALSGVDEIYAVGGAQAIGAMAYGTESIAAVDVIAGPGNVYVALAKQMVAGDVGVAAAFAGPSEVVVVADHTANPSYAAIDVILQAEHGPDGLAWLVTWDPEVAESVCAAGDAYLEHAARAADVRATLDEGGYVALVDDRAAAVAVVDAIAPEHLELQIEDAIELGRQVTNAGAIFSGHLAPASVGDYIAGPSHVLPTYGSARFASALTITDFLRDQHIVTVDEAALARLGPHVIALAEVEGLAAHAHSVRLRLDEAIL